MAGSLLASICRNWSCCNGILGWEALAITSEGARLFSSCSSTPPLSKPELLSPAPLLLCSSDRRMCSASTSSVSKPDPNATRWNPLLVMSVAKAQTSQVLLHSTTVKARAACHLHQSCCEPNASSSRACLKIALLAAWTMFRLHGWVLRVVPPLHCQGRTGCHLQQLHIQLACMCQEGMVCNTSASCMARVQVAQLHVQELLPHFTNAKVRVAVTCKDSVFMYM